MHPKVFPRGRWDSAGTEWDSRAQGRSPKAVLTAQYVADGMLRGHRTGQLDLTLKNLKWQTALINDGLGSVEGRVGTAHTHSTRGSSSVERGYLPLRVFNLPGENET